MKFLSDNQVKYHHIIFNAPYGERILVNDDKPSGLHCSHAVNLIRDEFNMPYITENELL